MQLNELKPITKRPSKKRVGRGGKRGTYSGRGMKGQKSRAGNRPAPVVRELLKRYPKLKGYRRVKRQRKPQSVSLQDIAKKFTASEVVSPASLFEKGLVNAEKGKAPAVKIVGVSSSKKAFKVEGCLLTKGARASIEKNGGSVS
ncbi:MAG: uL15 family ribosomal protein [bacterium]|nr:uL15 family ribosomal protein [bacterium]